ncbi:MAG: flagellar biosynthesis protein FlhB [Defluviitaleaceae bacterium]|nr:flagellar biosynthesis protein FlhB [Defluviitaleaceae bacterium]
MKYKILIPLNLSLFKDSGGGGEKTEKATPKKRKKTRDEGQVAKSQEISTAAMLIFGFFALSLFGMGILNNILGIFENNFQIMSSQEYLENLEQVDIARHMAWSLGQVILITLPMFIVTIIVGVIINLLQVGWTVTGKPLRPKMSKLNPLKGFKRIFSLQSIVNLVKSLLKLLVVGVVVYFVLIGEIENIPALLNMSFNESVSYIGSLIITLGLTIGVLYIFIAALDYAYTKWKHERDLRMSKHEVKEEWKQSEGNPLIKGKIRQKMREASMRRMMQSVPQADVVITNPTHFAVALKYDMIGLGGAPVLLAKGVDFAAKRIKDAAREHDIPIVENPPLARAIYDDVEIDQEIPEALYVAVAEIMAYVFKLKNRMN